MTVIGYLDKTFSYDFLKIHDIKSNELIGTTLQLCFARVTYNKTLKEENPDDIIDMMVSANIGTLVKFNEETFEAIIHFSSPMPENVFNKYYNDRIPIYEN